MDKIAFYIMNSKGYSVLKSFIEKFGTKPIGYIVSSEDSNIKKDFFEEIKDISHKSKISFFNRFDNYIQVEQEFEGYKFAIGWRWIIEEERKLIVFHDSLLPKYRGFSPLVNCLINNEKVSGVTALFASNKYDQGNIISQKSLVINYPIKIKKAIKQIEPLYISLVNDIFLQIKDKKQLKNKIQDESKATYSLWLDYEDYYIDWHWDAFTIKRFIDATGYPYDNAKAYLNGNVIKFMDVEIFEDVLIENRDRHIGKVIFIENNSPVIICKTGLIRLIDIRDENNNKTSINFRSRFKSEGKCYE